MVSSLTTWDDDFARGSSGSTGTSYPVIHNGIYTLTLPDSGHRTFKIHTRKNNVKFAPGKRVISLLIGPDNENDYQMFGFVDDAGIHCWQRNQNMTVFTEVIERIADGEVIDGYELLISGRCVRCNRTLTDDVSIKCGIGPECRKKLGF